MEITKFLVFFVGLSVWTLSAKADLVKAAYEGAPDSDIQKLLADRKNVCDATPRSYCYSLEDISGAICDTANNKLSFLAKKSIWLSAFNRKTTTSQLSKTLYTLRKCQSTDEFKKTMALVFFLNTADSRNKKLSDFLIKWMGTLEKSPVNPEILLYKMHLSAFRYFIEKKPFLLPEVTTLSKGLLKYFDENSLWKSTKTYSSEETTLLSLWLYSVSSRLILDADLDFFSHTIEKHSFLLDKVSHETRYVVLQNLCLHWYNSQQEQRCLSFSKPWVTFNSIDNGADENRRLFEIRLASIRGDTLLAEKKVKEFISKYKNIIEKDPSKLAWLQLDLSSIYAYAEKFEDAKSALATFEVYCNGLTSSLCMIFSATSRTLIDAAELNCSKVNQDAQTMNNLFSTQVVGVPYDLVVSSYYNLYCLAYLDDKSGFVNSYKMFTQMINQKTSLNNFKIYASLLNDYVTSEKAELRFKELQQRAPSDLELKRILKLISKKKSK